MQLHRLEPSGSWHDQSDTATASLLSVRQAGGSYRCYERPPQHLSHVMMLQEPPSRQSRQQPQALAPVLQALTLALLPPAQICSAKLQGRQEGPASAALEALPQQGVAWGRQGAWEASQAWAPAAEAAWGLQPAWGRAPGAAWGLSQGWAQAEAWGHWEALAQGALEGEQALAWEA